MIRPLSRAGALPILFAACFAFGGVRPSFMLDYSSWHATNIVVVTPLSDDANFEVLESWKGDLRPGTIISVPDLVPEAGSVPIDRYPQEPFSFSNEISQKVPVVFPGGKIVLYLKGNSGTQGTTKNASQWAASDVFGDMKASAVWIHEGLAYGFVQIINPGRSVFVRLRYVTESNASGMKMEGLSEASLKERTFNVLHLQEQIDAALDIQDRQMRADALKGYADTKILPAKRFVLEELGKCGEAAMPTIRSMMDDPRFSKDDDALVEYANAGGTGAGPELASRLRADVQYWETIGPTLPVGWWNLIDEHGLWADAHGYRDRYSQTLALVRSLDKLHYSPALPEVMRLRNFWTSWQQLNDPSEVNQIADDADQFVKHCRSNAEAEKSSE